jgi:hypothetical protein
MLKALDLNKKVCIVVWLFDGLCSIGLISCVDNRIALMSPH